MKILFESNRFKKILHYLCVIALMIWAESCLALESAEEASGVTSKRAGSFSDELFCEKIRDSVNQASSSHVIKVFHEIMASNPDKESWYHYCLQRNDLKIPLWDIGENASTWKRNFCGSMFFIEGLGAPHIKLIATTMNVFTGIREDQWDLAYENWRKLLQKKVDRHGHLRSNGSIYAIMAAALCDHPVAKTLFLEILIYKRISQNPDNASLLDQQDSWVKMEHEKMSKILQHNQDNIQTFSQNSKDILDEETFPPCFGILSPQEQTLTIQSYVKMSDSGIFHYDILLGRHYRKSSHQKVLDHFYKASERGDPDAGSALLGFYKYEGIPIDEKCKSALKKSALQGNTSILEDYKFAKEDKISIKAAKCTYNSLKKAFQTNRILESKLLGEDS